MLNGDDMAAELGRVFEQAQLEGVFPSFYQAIPSNECDDGDGLMVNLTVIEPDLNAAQADTKDRIELSLHRLYYKDSLLFLYL